MNTSIRILDTSLKLLARKGYTATSMRLIAETVGVQPSVLYHYYQNKQSLLRASRQYGIDLIRNDLPTIRGTSAGDLLRSQLRYQFKHRLIIVALLQYFMAVPEDFPAHDNGYLPKQSYDHVLAYLSCSSVENRIAYREPQLVAKMILHLIDGFLIEYVDHEVSHNTTSQLVESLASFIESGLVGLPRLVFQESSS